MRAVVSDDQLVQAHYRKALAEEPRRVSRKQRKAAEATARRKAARGDPLTSPPSDETPSKDDYLTKLAKYVPAETIAVESLVFGAFDPKGKAIWAWIVAGAIVNVIYLFSTAVVQTKKALRPSAYFYVLSVVAFLAWAIATISPFAAKMGIKGDDADVQKGAILALAAFLIPALDTIFARVRFRISSS